MIVQVPADNITLWHHFSGATNPGADYGGIETFLDPTFQPMLRRVLYRHLPWGVKEEGLLADAVVFNSGLHDEPARHPAGTFDHTLHRVVPWMCSLANHTRVIWRGNSPSWPGHLAWLGDFDRLVEAQFAGTRVTFLNVTRIALELHSLERPSWHGQGCNPQWYDRYSDGTHIGVIAMYNDRFRGNKNNFLSALTVQQLLHEVCLP
jgi:hypothetical protein